jgi:uncharacterized RDD family membrane protein YckC
VEGDGQPGLRPAGFWRRAFAFAADALLLALLVFALRLVASLVYEEALTRAVLDAQGRTFALYRAWHGFARDALGLGVPFVYFVLLEGAGGATFGKRLTGIRVRGPEGRHAGFFRALVRNVGKAASFGCCCGGVLLVAFTTRKRAFHDFLAGTDVCRDRA